MNQCESSGRHDDELQHRADRYILRLLEYILEITGGEAHAHAEHDDTEQRRDLRGEWLHHFRPENTENADQHDADGHVFRAKTNDERKHRVAPFPKGFRVVVAASPRSFDSGRSCSGIRYLTYDVSRRSG